MTDDLGKSELVEKLCDAIVDSYDEKMLKNIVWDSTFDELIQLEMTDLMMHAEDFGVYTDDLDL
jgi:hypothetical protein